MLTPSKMNASLSKRFCQNTSWYTLEGIAENTPTSCILYKNNIMKHGHQSSLWRIKNTEISPVKKCMSLKINVFFVRIFQTEVRSTIHQKHFQEER